MIFLAFWLEPIVLIHPAYNENTGTVLLEALVAGLPVLCTEMSVVMLITLPMRMPVMWCHRLSMQNDLNQVGWRHMLISDQKLQWQKNALAFAQDTADIYSLPERAAAIIRTSWPEQTASSSWHNKIREFSIRRVVPSTRTSKNLRGRDADPFVESRTIGRRKSSASWKPEKPCALNRMTKASLSKSTAEWVGVKLLIT